MAMCNRQFGTFLILASLSLFEHQSPITSALEAPSVYKKEINTRFAHYLSICPFSDGNHCIEKNKIICAGNTCKREEVIKVNQPGSFEFLLSKISSARPVNLKCNATDSINITDIVYHSPGDFRGFCFNYEKECDSVNESVKCNKPEPCIANPDFKMADCESRDSNLTSKLQLQCSKKNGSCVVIVPIKKIDNYDTCVKHDDEGEVKCSDAINYCYSKEVLMKYNCIPPETTSKPSSEPTSKATSKPTSQLTSNRTSNTSQLSSNTTSKPSSKPTSNKTSEPTSQPISTTSSEPTSKPTSNTSSQPKSKPISQPTSNTTSEPTSKPLSEATSKPTSEPTSKPTSEPTLKSSLEVSSELPSEPTPEPPLQQTPEPTSVTSSETTLETRSKTPVESVPSSSSSTAETVVEETSSGTTMVIIIAVVIVAVLTGIILAVLVIPEYRKKRSQSPQGSLQNDQETQNDLEVPTFQNDNEIPTSENDQEVSMQTN